MKEKQWGWWEAARAALTVVVLAAVGWQFYRDLSGMEGKWPGVRLEWLALAALLYLVGMSFSALYWGRLMAHLGASPGILPTARAYYISQLGKYVPGKALALVVRVGLIFGPKVPMSTAALAAFHEVLATMASGALVACACSPLLPVGAGMNWEEIWSPEGHDPGRWEMLALAGALALMTAGPILPPIFNRLAEGVTRPFRTGDLPQVGWSALGEGLVVTAPCWAFFGLALGCGLSAVGAEVPSLPLLIAGMAVAYVGGFVVPISPGGLGVREFLLVLLLAPHLGEKARAEVALAVLLLRLSWTLAEVVAAGILYWKDEGGRMKDESEPAQGDETPGGPGFPSSFILHPSSFQQGGPT
jgi:uncharacterized membrane protein YbhN (UPF0104 family)